MNKKAVVWVSTVLYILISLAIIGIVLAAVNPRINSSRDKSIIEQTIIILNEIDENINFAAQTPGTRLKYEFKLSRGQIQIIGNKVIWTLEKSGYQYSEPNMIIKIGKISALTTDENTVILKLEYPGLNFNDLLIQAASNPYELFIENKGEGLEFTLA
ncbi:MAG: hypothetical protein ABH817_02395 [archaeon]